MEKVLNLIKRIKSGKQSFMQDISRPFYGGLQPTETKTLFGVYC